MAADALPRTRLFIDQPLAAEGMVALDGDRAHYLRAVLRQGPGDKVLAFNGRDGEYLASIETLAKSAGMLRLDRQTRTPVTDAPPSPWLVFAPLKGGRSEYVVEKAVELGVGRLVPVYTRRSDVGRINLDRLRANALEAAEQCERLDAPDVVDGIDLQKLLTTWEPGRTLFVAAESGDAQPLVTAVTAAAGKPVAFLVGPEGGFDRQELDALRRLPFVVSVGLGPRVLRADTAAFSALAVWQAAAGDWRCGDGDARPPNRV
ncbi:16S rRNA (uracil(1498)-N(3))-methyltransferase [Niveispirillum lacus]|uniref:Ribosomal RNA small subunit methyltransferase E n=1 Tax=Niveispirillum lacus TaxID=1981099 RepID=A0A255Z004_9PROT|nr:16S rRNA (uracil(1498)-N(3))-methyltransferase [Niveispirillum lacus]OYQ34796.1 16S rRNA (uracil(1498)-N(3))-methyltransferase [Niveispirillum lacus]